MSQVSNGHSSDDKPETDVAVEFYANTFVWLIAQAIGEKYHMKNEDSIYIKIY